MHPEWSLHPEGGHKLTCAISKPRPNPSNTLDTGTRTFSKITWEEEVGVMMGVMVVGVMVVGVMVTW